MTAAMTLPITVPFITPSPPHPTLPLIAPVIAPSPPCPLPAPWLSSPSLSPLLFQPPHFPITASTTSSSLGQTLQLPWTDEDAGCGEVGKEQERTERGAAGVGYMKGERRCYQEDVTQHLSPPLPTGMVQPRVALSKVLGQSGLMQGGRCRPLGSESLIHVFLAWAGGSPPSEPHLGYV